MARPMVTGHAITFRTGDNRYGVRPGNVTKPFAAAARPGVSAFVVSVSWRDTETAPGVHDLTFVDEVLDAADPYDIPVIFSLGHRSFSVGSKADLVAPPWIGNVAWSTPWGAGYQAPLWDPAVMTAYIEFCNAVLGVDHPLLLGMRSGETATGIAAGEHGYQPASYVCQLERMVAEIHSANPHRRIWFLTNYLTEGQSMLPGLCRAVSNLGAAVGNPDIFDADLLSPGDAHYRTAAALNEHFYTTFDALADRYTFSQANPPSYESHSPREIFEFAQGRGLNLIIWDMAWWRNPGIREAFPLISSTSLPAPAEDPNNPPPLKAGGGSCLRLPDGPVP